MHPVLTVTHDLASVRLSFFNCQMGWSQSQAHGKLRKRHEPVCPEHQHGPEPGRWLAARTTTATASPTQAWSPRQPPVPGPCCMREQQSLPLQVSVGSAHEDVGMTGAHTCVCSQTSPPRAAPRPLMLTHRARLPKSEASRRREACKFSHVWPCHEAETGGTLASQCVLLVGSWASEKGESGRS